MVKNILKQLSLGETVSKIVYEHTENIPAMRGRSWDVTSIDIIEEIMNILKSVTGIYDPFEEQKRDQNSLVMNIYPFLEEMVNQAPDPLYEALRLAILGNSIDFMTLSGSPNIKKTIEEGRNKHLPQKSYLQFVDKIKRSNLILYIGDNSGEIVLDKLFIDLLVERYGMEVVFVTRGEPTINDVTLSEAGFVGLDGQVKVIKNGIKGPLAGTSLKRCSAETRQWIEQTDLIIAKGGGNFETLHEDFDILNTDVSFLVVSKCENYNILFDASTEDPILYNRYH